MMRVLTLACLVAVLSGCSTTSSAAGGPLPLTQLAPVDRRTPNPSWVFDDRLHLLHRPEVGHMEEGDSVTITVDTRQRFGGEVATAGPLYGDGQLFFPTTDPGGSARRKVLIPPGIGQFYVSTAAANPIVMQPGPCPGAPVPAPAADALACVADPQRMESDSWDYDRVNFPTLYVCPSAGSARLIPAGQNSQTWSLLGKTGATYTCVRDFDVFPDPDAAVTAVTLVVTTDGTPREVGGVNTDGVWRMNTPLKPGHVSLELRVKYAQGVLNQKGLGEFDVTSHQERSLVRIQPEILTTRSFRAVNLAVAITPVSQRFFDVGPWQDGFWPTDSFLNGLNPSLVVRFSGDNVTLVQFGVGASVFLNRAMLINAGLLFGSSHPSRYWEPGKNFFLGFAIDPVLLTEIRSQGGGGSKKGE